MKKTLKFLAAALAVLLLMGMVACGDDTPGDENAPLSFDVTELASEIYSGCSFSDTSLAMVEDRDFALDSLLNVDPALVADGEGGKEVCVYIASATPEFIICIKAVDQDSAKTLYDGSIVPFVEYYIEGYSSYGPEQVPKLENAYVLVEDGYVIVVVSDDSSSTARFINDKLGI